jgi:hypothetical protein
LQADDCNFHLFFPKQALKPAEKILYNGKHFNKLIEAHLTPFCDSNNI